MAEQDDDDLELGDLRSVFSSMRASDEDPPDTGMAALMAAARKKAAEMKPQPSLWERFFDVVRRPPVLAFATVVVLVGGGAVMFRHRGEMKETVNVAIPAADQRKEEAAPVEVAAPEAKRNEMAPPAKPTEQPHALTAKQSKALNDQIDRVAKDAMLDIEIDKLAGKKKGRAPTQKAATTRPPKAPDWEGPRGASAGESESGGLDESRNIPKERQTRAPARNDAVDPVAMAPSDEPGGPPVPKVSSSDLVTKWEAAAAARNCTLANSLGAQLAERDQALYMRTFQKNQSLQDCFNSKP
ncbi:hypothetical protein BH11MYX2_BH11MYX2_17220 [soil metagenome]